MRVDSGTEFDDAEIRRLLRETPIEGEIRIAFEREPNSFLAGGVEGDRHQVAMVRDEMGGSVMGIGCRNTLETWVNGESTRIGYLSQLRVADRHFGARALRAGFGGIRRFHEDGAARFYLSTIVEDNLRARRVLEAGIDGLPTFRRRETLITLVIPLTRRRKRRVSSVRLERGTSGTLSEIEGCLDRFGRRHQFTPRWSGRLTCPSRCRALSPGDFLIARRGEQVIGCLARWDQRGFKQSVVKGYGRRLGLVRPFVNLLSPWLGQPRLPRPGQAIDSAFLSHLAVDEDDPDTLLALLEAAHDDSTGSLDYLVLGLADRHPLLATVRRAFPHREYRSMIYLVFWEDGIREIERIDDRIPHLEVAIL